MSRNKRLVFFESLEMSGTTCGGEESGRTPPAEILLVRFGKNTYTKDGAGGEFEFSEGDADAVIGEFQGRGRDAVIDYEHQTLRGEQSPAAGWIEGLTKSAEGLVAKVRYWTRQAEEYLKAGEYRYISPVLQFSRRARTVVGLHSAALTNHPALHGMPALVADDAAEEDLRVEASGENTTEASGMEDLADTLGLGDLAGEGRAEKIREEVRRLVETRDRLDEFLGLRDCESIGDLEKLMAGMVPASEKAELEARVRKMEAEAEVRLAFSEGKLTESLRKWAEDFAGRDLGAFKEWSLSAPPVAPTGAAGVGEGGGVFQGGLGHAGRAILRNLGISDERMDEMSNESKNKNGEEK